MSKLDPSQAPEVRPLLDEIGRVSAETREHVSEEIRVTREKGYLTEKGTLSDVVAPPGVSDEVRTITQVFAATQPDDGRITPTRRGVLAWILGTATAYGVAIGSAMNVAELLRNDTYDESFIREVLRMDSDKPRLQEWRESLLSVGQTEKAELLSLLIPAGESFEGTFNSILRLKELLQSAKLSNFSKIYLKRANSHHYRYLGLHVTARRLFAESINFETEDGRLNTHLLNSRHMNRYKDLYSNNSSAVFAQALSADNQELSKSFGESFGADISSLATVSFQEARSVSSECAALKGLYYANRVMAAFTEKEALDAMDDLDKFREQMVTTIDRAQSEWRLIRQYGEAIWWYGRVAIIAFLKSWDRVLVKSISSFYEPSSAKDKGEEALLRKFHEAEAVALRSPVWIQTALIRAMSDEIKYAQGRTTLARLLAGNRVHKFRRNTEIQRAFDAVTVAFGRDPDEINAIHSLVTIESPILIDCVRRMQERLSQVW